MDIYEWFVEMTFGADGHSVTVERKLDPGENFRDVVNAALAEAAKHAPGLVGELVGFHAELKGVGWRIHQ